MSDGEYAQWASKIMHITMCMFCSLTWAYVLIEQYNYGLLYGVGIGLGLGVITGTIINVIYFILNPFPF